MGTAVPTLIVDSTTASDANVSGIFHQRQRYMSPLQYKIDVGMQLAVVLPLL